MTSIPTPSQAPTRRKKASRGGPRGKWTLDSVSFFVVCLGVPLAVFLIFVIWPFIQAGFYSLTNWKGFSPEFDIVGLANYTRLAQDPRFVDAVGNSIVFAIFIPAVTLVIAMTFAVLITIGGPGKGQVRGVRNAGFYRVVSLFPYVIPQIAIGLMWLMILDPSNGLVNGILTGLGLDKFQSFAWLGSGKFFGHYVAFPVTVLIVVWGLIGFYMLLFIAAIKGVPAEIYEASRIDGAGRFRMTTSITIPLIRDNIQTAYIYIGILSLDLFVYLSALNPNGGPERSTWSMTQQLFQSAFGEGRAGYASAMGVVIAVLTLLFAAVVFTVNRLAGGKDEGGAL